MQTNELRERYLTFFETKGCVRKPSDVLVPKWDPSVLFTPAGMNQFKDHFLGRVKLEFTKATTCQKCLRTGDIDNVGRTAYHHTFFEMLGNFSFGDYFKREAIHWAWEFLTDPKWLGIPKEKLSVTVYQDDHEAAKIWFDEIGIPEYRLKYLGEDDNFWPASAPSQGPDGVCGPCSEIYHDTPSGPVEIWNLVFTQFNRIGAPDLAGTPGNNLHPLPSKNIDTGMGLERCAAVLQGVDTNYHIDILRPLVEAAAEVLGIKYNPQEPGTERSAVPGRGADHARRLRRIADHIRACAFAVHENVYPGNKEEKYVIRRLLRRAVLDGRQMGYRNTFLHLLVPKVAELMREPYPELSETTVRVAKVIETEESNFIETVDSGLDKIERIFDQSRNREVAGVDIFDMYQTYGFPPELFETLASDRGFAFDWPGFKKEMERHGEISGSAEKNLLFKEDVLAEIKKKHKTEFVGYDTLRIEEAKIVAIVEAGNLVEEVEGIVGAMARCVDTTLGPVAIVLDKTPFYGEKGGQIGDEGELFIPAANFEEVGRSFLVKTTQIDGELILHVGDFAGGCGFKVGDIVVAKVDEFNRQAIARAHTATHLLHSALHASFGSTAEQQGSKVSQDELRFDFTYHQAVDKKTLRQLEMRVNNAIIGVNKVFSQEMDINDARKTRAMMLFGEKYPERVRVVSVAHSTELCGGTHVENTSEIGLFKIVSEESISAGIRRITAVTGCKAITKFYRESSMVQELASLLKVPAEEILTKVTAMQEQIKKAQKQLKTMAAGGKISVDDLISGAQIVGGIKIILWDVPDSDIDGLRQLVDRIRTKTESVAMLFSSVQEDKVTLIAGLSKDLVARQFDAVVWIRSVVSIIGGKGGGGNPGMAQAGGKDPTKLAELFAAAKEWFESLGSQGATMP